MYGAILGDIIGAPFEFDRTVNGVKKSKDFPLFSKRSGFTDDSVMTIAVAEALINAKDDAKTQDIYILTTKFMQKWGKKYKHAGYGTMFRIWLGKENPMPYDSFGNGSAMRVSSVGWIYDDLKRTRDVAR